MDIVAAVVTGVGIVVAVVVVVVTVVVAVLMGDDDASRIGTNLASITLRPNIFRFFKTTNWRKIN